MRYFSPLSTFQQYFQSLLKGVRNPGSLFSFGSASPESILSRVRNVDRAHMASGAVLLAEVLGFFTVGEMIGRFKLVGYRGEKEGHH